MLSGHSFNALLKTLEEPPPHVKFILATTDPQKLPVTILSRCLRFNLSRLLPEQIAGQLEKILRAETVQAEAPAIIRSARAADGSMRDGLSLLDQAIAYGGGSLNDSEVASMLGSIDHVHTAAIIKALADTDADCLLETVHDLVRQSRRLETVLDELAEAMHRIALIHAAPDFRDPERADWDSLVELAGRITPEDAQLYYQVAVTGRRDLELAPDPRTGLEMTLLRMLAFRPAEAVAAAPPAPATGGKPRQTRSSAPASGQAGARRQAQSAAVKATTPQPEPPTQPAGPQRQTDWMGLLEQLDISGQVRELARNVQLKSRSEDRWEFVIAPALRHLGSAACLDRLGQAISTRVGHAVRVRLVDEDGVELQTAASLEEERRRRNMSEAERAIADDPTVRELEEQMGAVVVEDSIQPLQ